MSINVRDQFGKQLAKLAKEDSRVLALDGDLGNSTRLDSIEKETVDSFLQMGIAEQNMVGVAAGLASVGFQPWVCSFATFLTKRALDQIVVSVAQTNFDVKLVGSYSGLLTSNTGKTHHSLDDIAIMTTIPNMTVIAPSDPSETVSAMKAMHKTAGPMYLRLTRDETIPSFLPNSDFEIGKGKTLAEGTDILLVTTGSTTFRVNEVIKQMEGVSIAHLHFPTLKPFDKELLIDAARKVPLVVTVEEHYIRGGLGSIVSEILSEELPKKVVRIGVPDRFLGCGTDEELLESNGLSVYEIRKSLTALCSKQF
ncbi:transketolase family protein [Psychrobacillus psychrodurans]|uniref:transketolase family protein n=1 Tax=Psychrobacillus psychrodurans TaxID=126157 RepID=UPI0008E8BEAF|nr:transketolase C-terminal domain-containing protein [Psychrobacillus psychrodurans]MCZ8539130.1 transketolase family protein [Psychrobacillus psychrodurans]SFM28773.1 transketolase [Psychrobacillus psychrodurans]